MDEAEKHAQAVIPQNAPLMKMVLFGMIPESIRFALDLTLYPKYVYSERGVRQNPLQFNFHFRETDKYFRNLINFLSCDFERKQNAGVQSSPDFVSLMLQSSISVEEGKDPNKEIGFHGIS